MNKAYKLLSLQEGISHKKAKEWIDKGLVSVGQKKIHLARMELPQSSVFKIEYIKKPEKLFENHELLAVNKPAFIESYELAKQFRDWTLLHRLDQETSGVILLVKENSDFHIKAKKAFKNQQVYKEYRALVSGFVSEKVIINKPISTIKKGFAKSRIDANGLFAHTEIEPLEIFGKKTLLKAVIKTGRTHQIRVHLKSIGHSIVGDRIYGGIENSRLMLHSYCIRIFDYEIISPLPKEFQRFG